jgi:hypothetical protein
MPPTDLDVVDVTGEFPAITDDEADDEIFLVDEPKTPEPASAGPEQPAARPTA